MSAPYAIPLRSLAAAMAAAAVFAVAPAGEADAPGPLRLDLRTVGGARVVGDHETVTATVTNTGHEPLHDVLVMLSLADVGGSPAVPLGLEDWTPEPEAARALTLQPGHQLTGMWRLRMIQAGRLAVFATAVASKSRAVVNSEPLRLAIAPTRNLTPGRVLPIAVGIPLVASVGAAYMSVARTMPVMLRQVRSLRRFSRARERSAAIAGFGGTQNEPGGPGV